jgi:hypothetical protein
MSISILLSAFCFRISVSFIAGSLQFRPCNEVMVANPPRSGAVVDCGAVGYPAPLVATETATFYLSFPSIQAAIRTYW